MKTNKMLSLGVFFWSVCAAYFTINVSGYLEYRPTGEEDIVLSRAEMYTIRGLDVPGPPCLECFVDFENLNLSCVSPWGSFNNGCDYKGCVASADPETAGDCGKSIKYTGNKPPTLTQTSATTYNRQPDTSISEQCKFNIVCTQGDFQPFKNCKEAEQSTINGLPAFTQGACVDATVPLGCSSCSTGPQDANDPGNVMVVNPRCISCPFIPYEN
jgi:hypothetical protein